MPLDDLDAAGELFDFGKLILVTSAGVMVALLASRFSATTRIPAPAILLLAATLAAEFSETIRNVLSLQDVERIAVVALILILFDGGMSIGWRQFRRALVPIASLGIVGTFLTAGLIAVSAHYLFDFDWTIAWIIGAAIAPTDPAVMFSVLGNREVGGRSGTILEGESGANDPVGIALMIGLIEFATSDGGGVGTIFETFAIEMAVGLALGIVGGLLLRSLMQKVELPNEALYTIRTLAAAGLLYGVAAVAGGSGFLAVFVGGVIVGDIRAPYKVRIERFHDSLSSLAEIVVFVTLGLTVDLSALGIDNQWQEGLVLAVILAFVARPLVVGSLLLPVRLRWGEHLFVMWGGLKGAVPIVLGSFVLLADVPESQEIYGIVFVVVTFSVIFQGASVPSVARRLGVPMEEVQPEPWDVKVRFKSEPRGVHRLGVGHGSPASGSAIRELAIGSDTWISLVVREGRPVQARGDEVLQPGDEVLLLTDEEDVGSIRGVFDSPLRRPPR